MEHTSSFTVFQRQHVHVRVLTVSHAKDDVGPTKGESTSVSEGIKCVLFKRIFQFSPIIRPIALFKTPNYTNSLNGSGKHNNLLGECGKRIGGKERQLSTQHIPEGR